MLAWILSLQNHIRQASFEDYSMPVSNALENRCNMAKIITEEYFPVSPRQLSTWPVSYRIIGRESMYNPEEVRAEAKARLENAPLITGGCK